MQRIVQVVRVRPEHQLEYERLHAEVWPEVLDRLRRSHITNYSIHVVDGLLVSYYEYTGVDHEADQAAIAADETTRRWWQLTEPLQEQLSGTPDGSWWKPARQVFFLE